ncbi:lipopolysaccharide heptosyltransferase II [Halioglobus sp. HI00S01]|uniref:lipopolysaccharide heptosyltransferase II n=1 Tax=Halioglobus sp. HI00S01 TaxID=1822214 RepID=UPI0007C2AECF|nr:lipopolysaccharide heptosyltransferase II [Halioglobus sp. HI00S01]KZX58171.1 lipopolysaccharide heptosyltransferase II [Halioglobus sp. HI00S01]
MSSGEKILIVGPSWVGDMVMSQVLYRLLEQTRPGVIIDVMAPGWSEPILERMPQVRRAINLPVGHGEIGLRRRWHLGRTLREEQYDQAIILPNSLKSALVPAFAGIPRRTGWRGEMRYGLLNDMRLLDEEVLPLMVQQFAALGIDAAATLPDALPAPQLTVDSAQAEASRQKFSLRNDKPLLALCPGAEFGGAKRWPAQYYAELARQYLHRDWQIVLFGSANDQVVTAEIAEACGQSEAIFDLAGRTALAEAVDMLSLADAVVSNDSGLMHIAAALGRPLVVIYGATSPGFTPPLNPNSATLVSDIDCAPCFERECPLGHHRCMRETPASLVAGKLDVLLAEPA